MSRSRLTVGFDTLPALHDVVDRRREVSFSWSNRARPGVTTELGIRFLAT